MTGFDIGGLPNLPHPQPRLLGDQAQEPGRVSDSRGGTIGDGSSGSFGDALANAIEQVDRLGDDVTSKAESLARGEDVEVHDLMVAMGKSEVAFNLMLEVRNKIIEAWQQISRSVG